MPKIHWLGTGLSSMPGLKALIKNNYNVMVWNRSKQKAIDLLQGVSGNFSVNALMLDELEQFIDVGDVVVSMLPNLMHETVAMLCLKRKAHFVSSSYISTAMQRLHQQAENMNLCFVNEVGLDPGLDHIFGQKLVSEFKNSGLEAPENKYYFRSYCGGFPSEINDFRYKFSWSPLGVLRALKADARYIQDGNLISVEHPYREIHHYSPKSIHCDEVFEAYGNRNSIEYIRDYNIPNEWNLQQFIRGTLRLNGWANAWKNIFLAVEDSVNEANDFALEALSKKLEEKHTYHKNEHDRVVLSVELMVKNHVGKIWHKSYLIDATGTAEASAMARLVSLPVSFAVNSVLSEEIRPGVSGAPGKLAQSWINKLELAGEKVHYCDISQHY